MRLIDADALNISIEKEFDGVCVYDVSASEAVSDMQSIVDKQPTIEERKTGHWVEMGQNEDGTHNICCGVCGKFKIKSRGHANSAYTKSKYRFCGGCGAHMIEKEDAK